MSDEQHNASTTNESGSTAVATRTRPARPTRKPLPQWKVLLHNDDMNEMGYVVETIVALTPLNPQLALIRMFEAHNRGLALLLTTHREHAELIEDQFTSKGLTVTIEPE